MERTNDDSASRIPKLLVYSAMTFLILRLITFGYEMHFSQTIKDNPVSTIGWIDLTERLRDKAVEELTAEEHKPETELKEKALCKRCKQEVIEKRKLIGSSNKTYKLEDEIGCLLGKELDSNKLVIYEFFSPSSDPCLSMESSLSNSQVTGLIKDNFVPVRVTYNRGENVLIGKSLVDFRRKYNVCAFPTLVVVDQEGEMVANLVGNCSSLTTFRFLSRTVASSKIKSIKS